MKKSISKKYDCPNCKDTGFILFESKTGTMNAIQCECIIKKAKENKLKSLVKYAEMPEQLKEMKINDYDVDMYNSDKDKLLAKKAKTIVINFIKNYEAVKESKTGLYFYSQTKGSGKTRLAIGIGNALIEKYGEMVKFCTTTKLIEEIKASFNNKDYTEYLEATKSVPVLILDDIGTEKLTDWVNETFYSVINERMLNGLITIYTSNCLISELKHDDRIKSRIEGTVYPIKCPEEDIRIKLKRNDNVDFEKILLT